MADNEGYEARERAREAMALVGDGLARGVPPDPEVDGQLAEFAARIDSRLWEPRRPRDSPR
ncbi:MAG: hypothetical protein H5T82_03345 [Demequina sp.]|uniref:hypothetical protein n=1 Tax=Demequina sp. TaxID=2050685 RepID=UPI0019A4B431|nr:hypothetical protein [Demequina sp.]MBC7297908.1 hypothetical protein [Demequina sp.]